MPDSKAKPRLLFVLHNFHNRAGTEEHTKLLAAELSATYEIAFLFPQHDSVVLRTADGQEKAFPGAHLPWPITPADQPVVKHSVKQALDLFRPTLIHIQHAFYWPLNLIDWLCDTGVPVVMSFHEYFAITPLFTMIGTEDAEVALSEKYVRQIFGQDIRPYLLDRIRLLRKAFGRLRARIVPSESLASILHKLYPAHYTILPHGIRQFDTPVHRCGSDTIKFGYVGSMLPQKGWRELARAWPRVFEQHPSAELHFFGGAEMPANLPLGSFAHGVYEQSDLPAILSQFHIGVLPSVFAETFSLVLSELQLAGLPVAASRMGVFRERIKPGVNGWLFNPFSAESIAEVLGNCITDQSWQRWQIPRPRLAAEMAQDYDALYRSLL